MFQGLSTTQVGISLAVGGTAGWLVLAAAFLVAGVLARPAAIAVQHRLPMAADMHGETASLAAGTADSGEA